MTLQDKVAALLVGMMSGETDSLSAEVVRDLFDVLHKFEAFAKAHEAWEAATIDDPWLDAIPDKLYRDMTRVQSLRNIALDALKG